MLASIYSIYSTLVSTGWWVTTLIVTADIGTGVVHWFEDSYLTPEVNTGFALLDGYLRGVAVDNDKHHSRPNSMHKFSYFENLTTSVPPVLGIGGLVVAAWAGGLVTDVRWWTCALALGGSGNLFHRFAHQPGPQWIQALQRKGLIQTMNQHKLHHYTLEGANTSKEEPLSEYCVITSFVNPVLDELQAWRTLENMIEKFTGVYPNHRGETSNKNV